MSAAALVCWRCGAALPDDLFPLRREEVCPACDADLHVCRLCRFHNPSVSDGCDEPVAAPVTNRERANFCDYHTPVAGAWRGAGGDTATRAREALDALFGDGPADPAPDADDARAELDRLFGLDGDDER